MEMRNTQLPPPPPGIIPAFVSGFNAIANRAVVILIPIAFDLFLWLGPRFGIYNLVAPALSDMESVVEQNPAFLGNMGLFSEFFQNFNAFSALRTFPMGVFSLMSVSVATSSPLGERQVLEVSGLFIFLLCIALMTVVGWLLGGLYFYSVARIVTTGEEDRPSAGRSLLQGTLLSGFWSMLWLVFSLPIFIFMGVLLLISPAVMTIVYLLIMLVVLWLSVPVFFSAHGVFLNADHLFRSIMKSFRMMRYALPSLGWFVIVAIVLSQGLNFLWRIAPADSWMTLFGIFGHAFISTALLAASFFYYRDLNDWVEAILIWMKARAGSVQA